jgi:O-antigen/teichoic acid export membrane protein
MTDEIEKPAPPAPRAGVLATVAKNSVANLARTGLSWLVVLLLPPLLVRVLDKPTYATWVLILQIGAYVALVDSGIQSAVGRFVARAEGLQDRHYMGRMLTSAALTLLAAALVAALATVICSWQLAHLFHGIPPAVVPMARAALLVIGLSLAISLPFSTFAGAFLGFQMNQVNTLAGSLGKLAGAAGAAWAAWRHQGLLVMALWIGFGNLLQSAIYFIAWKRLRLRGLLHKALVTAAAIREFSTFCAAVFATQFASLLITGMDIPVVAAFDFHAAAYYAVAATASNMLGVPQAAIVGNLIPVASGISAVHTPERLGQVLIRTTRYATAILCLITLPLLFAMFPFLRLWVGMDYAVHALPLALILIVAQFIRLTLMPYAAIGFGAGQQQRMLISPLGEGIVNLGCSILGVLWLGAIGVALGTLIGACVGDFLHFVNSMPRTDSMAFSRRQLVLTGIARPMACCLPSLLLLLAALRWIPAIPLQLAVIAIGETLAAIIVWKANFHPEERREMIGLAKKMFSYCLGLARAGA